jgi:hypothetical protein
MLCNIYAMYERVLTKNHLNGNRRSAKWTVAGSARAIPVLKTWMHGIFFFFVVHWWLGWLDSLCSKH